MSRLPNILLLMLDATRADRLSCYGYEGHTTPNLDQIAREGVLYENAFAPDVWTLPVMASVFTGQLPYQHGATFSNPRLASELPTLASMLTQQGYATAAVSCSSWISQATELARGFTNFREAYRLFSTSTKTPLSLINRLYAKYVFRRYDKGARRVNRITKHWLQRELTPPFFLFLHYLEPHYPYLPPRPYANRYFDNQNHLRSAKKINHHPLDFFAGHLTLSEEDFAILNRLYDAEIAYLDMRIGEIYTLLAQVGHLDDTVVVVFADHGENIGHHQLLDHHFCLYDSLIHVPLIIRYPPRFPQGVRVSSLIQSQDLFSTLTELAGISVPSSRHCRSLMPEAIEPDARSYVLSETRGDFLTAIRRRQPLRDLDVFDRTLRAVRTERYKYIEDRDGSAELYALTKDPEEAENIAGENPELCVELREILLNEFPPHHVTLATDPDGPNFDDPTLRERLQALGYLE